MSAWVMNFLYNWGFKILSYGFSHFSQETGIDCIEALIRTADGDEYAVEVKRPGEPAPGQPIGDFLRVSCPGAAREDVQIDNLRIVYVTTDGNQHVMRFEGGEIRLALDTVLQQVDALCQLPPHHLKGKIESAILRSTNGVHQWDVTHNISCMTGPGSRWYSSRTILAAPGGRCHAVTGRALWREALREAFGLKSNGRVFTELRDRFRLEICVDDTVVRVDPTVDAYYPFT